MNSVLNSASDGFPYLQNTNASMTTNAVYSGLQTTLWNRLTLTGQVRQDYGMRMTRRSPGASARC